MSYLAAVIYFAFPCISAFFFGPVLFGVFCIVIGPLNIVSSESIVSPFGPINILAIKALGILFGGLITLIFYSPAKYAKYNVPWFHILFVLFFTISILWSPSIEFSVRSLQKIIIPVIFVFVGLSVVRQTTLQPKNLLNVTSAIIGTATFMSVISVLLKVSGFSSSPALSFPVIGQAVFSANVALGAVSAFARFIVRRQLYTGMLSAFLFCVVVGAFTRVSIVATFCAMALIFMFTSKGLMRAVLPLVSMFCLIALFLFVPDFKERMFLDNAEVIKGTDLIDKPVELLGMVAGSGRYDLWDMLLEKFFWPNPLFGSGIGSVQWFLYHGHGAQAPHSDYVRLLCDGGIVGLVLFVFTLGWYYARMVKVIVENRDIIDQEISLAAAGVLTVYVIFMSTDNAFDYVTQIGIQVFILVGSALGLSNGSRASAGSATYRPSWKRW